MPWWPADWPEAHQDPKRCWAIGSVEHPVTGSKVVLTTAHLPGREIEQCGDDDLKAMCQRCHLRMDAPLHAKNSAATRRKKKNNLELDLKAE